MASFSDPPVAAEPGIPLARRLRLAADGAPLPIPQTRTLAALGVAAPLVAVALARLGPSAQFLVAAFVIVVLCVLSAIDFTEHRLPNRIVLPSFAVVLLAQIALFPDQAFEWVLASALACAAMLVLHIVYPQGLGLGDVKLALLLGAALGSDVMAALLVGTLAGAAYAAVLIVRDGGAARHTAFAFGPFLAFGAVVALLF